MWRLSRPPRLTVLRGEVLRDRLLERFQLGKLTAYAVSIL